MALFNKPQNASGINIQPHQKSLSFGNNLYQHATNFGSQVRFVSGMNPYNPNVMSTPILQSPTSTFTTEQLNNQFSQFMPFSNPKNNMHSVTESDSLWQ